MSSRTENPGVVVTGMGVVTPLGNDLDHLWKALLEGTSAVQHWPDLAAAGFRVPLAARVTSVEGQDECRGRNMAVIAASAALRDAGLTSCPQLGIFVGTTMGESAAFEQAAAGNPIVLPRATAHAFPQAVREAVGGAGPLRAYATACAAGNYAIGAAARAVASGRITRALAGGVEPFSRIALAGFSRSRAMANELCRPFDRRRNGMQLGEAAAFLLLERHDAARARGARIYARIGPLGLSCDAYHPTAPAPDGSGMARAMLHALQQADRRPSDIDWICAHGSGTVASDAAEAKALHRVFGEKPPPVSAIKGALGHSMGAAAAIEAVVAILAITRNRLPPTANLRERDPDCALDVVNSPRDAPELYRALNCAYGFGGLNSALLLETL